MSAGEPRVGVDRPDGRGRIGLDRVGRDLDRYDRGNGAVILLYDAERRAVLLTRQFRFPAYVNDHPDGMLIEAAAGLLDDQDPETAMRREAREELGVVIGGGVAAEGEDIEIVELPYDEALGMIATGQIVDGKTIILLYWAALQGPFAGGSTP